MDIAIPRICAGGGVRWCLSVIDQIPVILRHAQQQCLFVGRVLTQEAEPLFHEAIDIGMRASGAVHPLPARYRSHFARLYLAMERLDEGLVEANTTKVVRADDDGPQHAWTKNSATVKADILTAALGRTDEAASLHSEYGLDPA